MSRSINDKVDDSIYSRAASRVNGNSASIVRGRIRSRLDDKVWFTIRVKVCNKIFDSLRGKTP